MFLLDMPVTFRHLWAPPSVNLLTRFMLSQAQSCSYVSRAAATGSPQISTAPLTPPILSLTVSPVPAELPPPIPHRVSRRVTPPPPSGLRQLQVGSSPGRVLALYREGAAPDSPAAGWLRAAPVVARLAQRAYRSVRGRLMAVSEMRSQ